MTDCPGLQKRENGYYYRKRVPSDLNCFFGKQREISIALGTKRRALAEQLCPMVKAHVAVLLDQLREAMGIDDSIYRQARQIAENWKRRILNEDFEKRILGHSHIDPAATQTLLGQRLDQIRNAKYSNDTAWAQTILNQHGLEISPNNPAWPSAAFCLLQADAERLEEILKRDHAPHQMSYFLDAPEVQEQKPVLSEALQKWKEEKDRPKRRLRNTRNAVKLYISYFGSDPTLDQLETTDIVKFGEKLKKLPRRPRLADQDLSIDQIIEKYLDDTELVRLKPITVNKNILEPLSQLLSWCVDRKMLLSNPAKGVRVDVPEVDPEERIPFDIDDLKAIFNRLPHYEKTSRYERGGYEACYWIPVLAYYTGAREEELGRLYPSDVKIENDITYIEVYVDFDKRVKRRSSVRKVPLHREVIELGFLDYVERIKLEGHKWLFPYLEEYDDRRTFNFSKWANAFLREECGITDARKVFHCFRHTFKDLCTNSLVSEEMNDALTGHKRKGEGRGYGKGPALSVRNDAIHQIKFPIKPLPPRG